MKRGRKPINPLISEIKSEIVLNPYHESQIKELCSSLAEVDWREAVGNISISNSSNFCLAIVNVYLGIQFCPAIKEYLRFLILKTILMDTGIRIGFRIRKREMYWHISFSHLEFRIDAFVFLTTFRNS